MGKQMVESLVLFLATHGFSLAMDDPTPGPAGWLATSAPIALEPWVVQQLIAPGAEHGKPEHPCIE